MSDDKEFGMVPLTGLWKSKTKNGDVMLSGNMGGARVIVLVNKFKDKNPKAPDYQLFVAKNKKKEESNDSSGGDDTPF